MFADQKDMVRHSDVKRVMEWMGHTAIVTTMRYMQIRPSGLMDVLHVLEPG